MYMRRFATVEGNKEETVGAYPQDRSIVWNLTPSLVESSTESRGGHRLACLSQGSNPDIAWIPAKSMRE